MSEMSVSESAGESTTQSNETTPAPSPPATPTPTPPSAPQNSGVPEFGSVLTALAALPEKIVDSLRESMQPATPPAQTGGQAQTPAQSQSPAGDGVKAPGQKSFTAWWFGR